MTELFGKAPSVTMSLAQFIDSLELPTAYKRIALAALRAELRRLKKPEPIIKIDRLEPGVVASYIFGSDTITFSQDALVRQSPQTTLFDLFHEALAHYGHGIRDERAADCIAAEALLDLGLPLGGRAVRFEERPCPRAVDCCKLYMQPILQNIDMKQELELVPELIAEQRVIRPPVRPVAPPPVRVPAVPKPAPPKPPPVRPVAPPPVRVPAVPKPAPPKPIVFRPPVPKPPPPVKWPPTPKKPPVLPPKVTAKVERIEFSIKPVHKVPAVRGALVRIAGIVRPIIERIKGVKLKDVSVSGDRLVIEYTKVGTPPIPIPLILAALGALMALLGVKLVPVAGGAPLPGPAPAPEPPPPVPPAPPGTKWCDLEGKHIPIAEWTERRCLMVAPPPPPGTKWCERENRDIPETEWTAERCMPPVPPPVPPTPPGHKYCAVEGRNIPEGEWSERRCEPVPIPPPPLPVPPELTPLVEWLRKHWPWVALGVGALIAAGIIIPRLRR